MSTLSDRYVWGVLRAVPQAKRAELEPEIRALVADAVEARADGTRGPQGRRARRARRSWATPSCWPRATLDRSMVLIGPRFYPEWRRLLAAAAADRRAHRRDRRHGRRGRERHARDAADRRRDLAPASWSRSRWCSGSRSCSRCSSGSARTRHGPRASPRPGRRICLPETPARASSRTSPRPSWRSAVLAFMAGMLIWQQMADADHLRRHRLSAVQSVAVVVLAALVPAGARPRDRVHARPLAARRLDLGAGGGQPRAQRRVRGAGGLARPDRPAVRPGDGGRDRRRGRRRVAPAHDHDRHRHRASASRSGTRSTGSARRGSAPGS